MFTTTNTGLTATSGCFPNNVSFSCTPSKLSCEGVYEYIIYILEEEEFELLEEGKIYANCEDGAREKVLFDFAKSEEGKNWDLEDLNIEVRLF